MVAGTTLRPSDIEKRAGFACGLLGRIDRACEEVYLSLLVRRVRDAEASRDSDAATTAADNTARTGDAALSLP